LPPPGDEHVRSPPGDDFRGFEWHEPEHDRVHGHYRWSGPSTESALPLPVAVTGRFRVTLHNLFVLEPDTLSKLTVRVNGHPVPTTLGRTDNGTRLLAFFADSKGHSDVEVTLVVPRTIRPFRQLVEHGSPVVGVGGQLGRSR
jgi:hypothetical protein